jgi:ribosomal protein L28
MSRICEASGKGVMHGGMRQHKRGKAGGTAGPWAFKAQRKRRTWLPNLRIVKVKINDAEAKIKISMKYYKKLKQEGKIWLKLREAWAYI